MKYKPVALMAGKPRYDLKMKIYRPKRLMPLWATLFLLLFSFAAMAQRPFITKWKINGSGEKITIPINSEVTGYNYNVDWGDGTSTTGHTATAEHYYFNAGTYTVSISGNFPALKLGSLSDPDFDYNAWKLIAIEQWGDMVWKSMEGAFFGAQDLVLNASDIPNLSNVTSLEDMFRSATNFIGSARMKDWDVSHIISMRNMFIGTNFNQDIGNWDVSQVKNMGGLFTATPFNQDISGWDVSRVEDMNNMFVNNPFFNQDISGWDVGQVKNMGSLFRNATAFNRDISSWDVSNVTDMQSMFRNAGSFNQNLSQWDIQAVNNMFEIFGGCVLSKANYDATLIGWASQTNIQSNVQFGALGLTFCASADARQYLIDEYGWNITGDSPACQSMLIFVKKEDGKTLTVHAEGSDAIQQLKQKIQDKSGIAVNMQRLFFNHVALEDGRTLADYGIGNGSTIELTLSPNSAPIAVDDPVNVTEDTPTTGNVLTNDSDPEGNAMTASLVTAPVNGTVVLNADGSFTYTPNSNYSGLDSLRYQVCDNGAPSLCDTAWVRFVVNAVNDAPVAVDDQVNVTENIPTTGNVLTNDWDPEGNALTASLITAPVNGTIVLNANGSFTYTPNQNYSGLDSLFYQVCDNGVPSLCDTAKVRFTVLAVNKAPTDILLSKSTVAQSAGVNGVVGSLSTMDLDLQDTHTYTFAAAGTDNSKFNIFNNNGNWVLRANNAASLASQAYALRIRTTDNNNKFFEKAFSITVIDDVAPVVTAVAVPADGYHREGDLLEFALDFNENVVVVGTPYIPVTIGTTVRMARYDGGSGTNRLLFNYVVQSGEVDMDGIALGVTINLNGGTIRDAAQNNAVLALQSIAPTNNVLVNAVRPTVTLSTALTLVNAPFSVTTTFSEAVTGFSLTDIAASNATISNLQTANNITYSFLVTPTAGGLVQLSLPENIAENIAANGNMASNALNVQYNKTIIGISLEDGTFIYDGTARSLAITGTLPVGTTVSYTNNSRTDVGTQEVTATVSGSNYEDLVLRAALTIEKATITGVQLDPGTFVYDGTARSLAITGTLPSGTTVSYENNSRTDVGTQEVTATVSGSNYEDLVLKAALTIEKATITGVQLDPGTFVYDGTARSLAITGTLPSGTTVSYENNSRTDVGTQDVTATVSGSNYDDLVLKAALTIEKATITGVQLDPGTFVYDGTARSLAITGSLPQGVSVTYTNNGKTEAGIYNVTANIDGGVNYNSMLLTATLTIQKATLSHLTLKDAEFVYDGSPKSLQVGGDIPNGISIRYENNAKINAGVYEVTAVVEPSTNYEGISLAARLTIKKAAQTITFNGPGVLGRDAGELPLDVAASSGLPIRLTVDEPLIATVSGVNLQVHRLGTVTVTAVQEGDANHEAAETVSLKIRIAAAADAKLPVRVHKAVSPNGDGINEFLMIEGIGDFTENKVTIFDKSGRVLQEIEGYDNKGRVFTGEYHRDGTYYYYIDVNDGGQWKREKGFFVVKRTVN